MKGLNTMYIFTIASSTPRVSERTTVSISALGMRNTKHSSTLPSLLSDKWGPSCLERQRPKLMILSQNQLEVWDCVTHCLWEGVCILNDHSRWSPSWKTLCRSKKVPIPMQSAVLLHEIPLLSPHSPQLLNFHFGVALRQSKHS